jgi:hypothetical protein
MKSIKLNRILYILLPVVLLVYSNGVGQQVGILKYKGGGDWYANPTAVPNLIEFCNDHISTQLDPNPVTVAINSLDIFNYPLVFMTGHGNVLFTENDAENLRNYLVSGGFLHVSDNYGLDTYIRREMKKVFPDLDFIEIPTDHPIYFQTYTFVNGIPKIHEHDNKPPQAFGLFYEGQLVCFYDYETDLSDGWEDEEIHNNSYETRLEALKMGANIVEYSFKN